MKRIIFLLAFVAGLTNVVYAQSAEYIALVKRQFAVLGTSINVDMLREQIAPIYAKQKGVPEESVAGKVNEYFTTRFLDDMAVSMVPFYEEAMSLADFEKYVSEIEKPEIGEALRKTNAAIKGQSYMEEYIMQMVEPDYKGVESTMPAAFKAVYDKYFEVTDGKTLVKNMIVTYRTVLGDDEYDLIGKLEKAWPVIMGNEIYAHGVTTQQLQQLVDLYSMPECEGVMTVTVNMSKDMTSFGVKLLDKVLKSLESM